MAALALSLIVMMWSAVRPSNDPQGHFATLAHPLAVNGLALGDSYAKALRVLGKPRRHHSTRNDAMLVEGDNWRLELRYDGLTVELTGERRNGPFTVMSVTLTGGTWSLVRGIRLGMSSHEVERRLGVHGDRGMDSDTGVAFVSYVNSDGFGFADFEFVDERLVRVRWLYDFS